MWFAQFSEVSPAYCISVVAYNNFHIMFLKMQLANCVFLGHDTDGTAPSLPDRGSPGALAASGRPDQRSARPRRDVAVDEIQATLGGALVVLASLAVVLLAVILVLVEADFILRLGGKLTRRWRSSGKER